jgi:hypothetical protein
MAVVFAKANGTQTVLAPLTVTNGDGSYSTPSGITATMAGTYMWSATYSGNATNNPARGSIESCKKD